MTYSLEFRKKVLKIKEKENLSYEASSKRFSISKAALFRWSKKLQPQKTRVKPATKIDIEALKKDIEQYPDSYCYERGRRLGASATGIRDAQYRLGVTYKKNSKSPQSGSRKKIYILSSNPKTKG